MPHSVNKRVHYSQGIYWILGLTGFFLIVKSLYSKKNFEALVISAFLFTVLGFCFVIITGSMQRMYLFVHFLTPCVLACVFSAVADSASLIWKRLPNNRADYFPKLKIILLLIALTLPFFMNATYQYSLRNLHIFTPFAYLKGEISYDQLITSQLDPKGYDRGLWDFVKEIRFIIGHDVRVHMPTHHPSIVYTFPGRGLVSEPSHNVFGKDPGRNIYGEPEQTKRHLKDQELNYFIFSTDPRSNPDFEVFSALWFSQLLLETNIRKFLTVVKQRENFYLLTWNETGKTGSIPVELIQYISQTKKRSIGTFNKMYESQSALEELLR